MIVALFAREDRYTPHLSVCVEPAVGRYSEKDFSVDIPLAKCTTGTLTAHFVFYPTMRVAAERKIKTAKTVLIALTYFVHSGR